MPTRASLRSGWRQVAPNVWFLGLTSLLTDVSSEMITSVLPLYVVLHLGMSPLGYGVIDGVQHGVSALLRLVSGALADRTRRYKEVAAAGYALSAVCKPVLALAGGNLLALVGVLAVDRTGKGIRTAPRDALVSLSARAATLGLAFGVHRSLDAAGAMLGPIVAFAVLAHTAQDFGPLFLVSFLVALAGLGALLLLVDNVRHENPASSRATRVPLRSLLHAPGFRRLLLGVTLLGLATVSDGFLYLALQRRAEFAASHFPLLFVGTSACYFLLATPIGHLADRVGRAPVFLGGYALLLGAYALLLGAYAAAFGFGPGLVAPLLCLAFLGAHYAATDGVVVALAASLLQTEQRASGLAILATAASLSRLAASIGFGFLWSRWSLEAALGVFAGFLLAAMGLSAFAMLRRDPQIEAQP